MAAIAASLMLSACAQMGTGGGPDLLASSSPASPAGEQPTAQDLSQATGYWGKKFTEDPRDLKAGLAYAKNLKAMGEKQRAMAVLQQLAVTNGQSRELASEYGRLALDMGQIRVAQGLLEAADDPTNPDWRVIAARGTVHAKKGEFKQAIPYYERALLLAPDHPSILNNLALAHTMNGEAPKAEGLLRRANEMGSANPKVRQNLALVLGLQGRYDEAKEIGVQDQPLQVAVADTQTIRQMVRLEPKAAPASVASAPTVQAAKQGTTSAPGLKPATIETPVARSWTAQVATSGEAGPIPFDDPAAR